MKTMKRMISLVLALVLACTALFTLAACKNDQDPQDPQNPNNPTPPNTPTSVTIKANNADKVIADITVPYNPQRIAVLDMPALDILDALGLGDRIVGSASVSIEYLKDYNPDDSNGKIANLGSVKTADMEAVATCAPDIIFIGGRLSSSYAAFEEIAPVVYLSVDYTKGVVQSTFDNAKTIASIFGKEAEVDDIIAQYNFTARVEALKTVFNGKNAVLGMYNNNALGLQDNESQLSILAKEIGFNNLSMTVGDSAEKPTHGESAGWETIVTLNPEYIFVLDRSSAVSSGDGVYGAREVIENDIIRQLDCWKNGNIIYFIEHANVWYTSTGGIQALDTMIEDLEIGLAPDMP